MALVGEDLYVATTDAVLRFAMRAADPHLGVRPPSSPSCRPAASTTTGRRT
jgi:hypothetical protein